MWIEYIKQALLMKNIKTHRQVLRIRGEIERIIEAIMGLPEEEREAS